MELKEYIDFLRDSGETIIELNGSYFWEIRKRFFESIPPHKIVSENRLPALALGVRYTTTNGNLKVNEFICDHETYDLQHLESKARNQTRRGLENCSIRRIQSHELFDRGLEINRSVFERQGRVGPVKLSTECGWKRYLDLIKNYRDIEIYGAFVEDVMCAYSLIVKVDDCAYIYHPMSDSNYLKYYPMNALIFVVTKQYLRHNPRCFISYGQESIKGITSLTKFKLGMGYRRRELNRSIHLNPMIKGALSIPFSKRLIKHYSSKIATLKDVQNFIEMIEEV